MNTSFTTSTHETSYCEPENHPHEDIEIVSEPIEDSKLIGDVGTTD